jgi:hypothetical protein
MTTVDLLERAAKALESAHEYRVEREHAPVAAELRARAARLRGLLASVHGAWDLSDENIQRGLLLARVNEPSPAPTGTKRGRDE